MTDPHELSAADERRVADFLSGLDDVPVPDEVVDRLDSTLERLLAARAQKTSVVPLRPRRRWATALVAAATVSVVGVGVGTIWAGNDRGSTAMDAVEGSGLKGPEFGALDSPSPPVGGTAYEPRSENDPLDGDGLLPEGISSAPAFTGAGFPAEVRAFLQGSDSGSSGYESSPCTAPVPADGSAHAATFEGADAVLVVFPVRDGGVRAQIFRCGGDDTPLASTVVPAP